MPMILKLIRQLLGRIIVFLNFIFPPRKLKRSQSEQERVDKETQNITLYQFHLCPFCVRVRRHIKRLNLTIQTLDAKKDKAVEEELIAGGGKRKVPCLRIQEGKKTTWLYESKAINDYLSTRFGYNG